MHESTTDKVWTVSEINRLVRDILEQSVLPFRLKAEVGDLTIHRSGHVYLTLKDASSQISAVFFRGAESVRKLELKTGDEVEVDGRLTVYEPRGNYQVLVTQLRSCGVGDLQRRFEELKKKLRAEGLFDEERKRRLPTLPACVGIVTSPQGAALRDFLRVLGRRHSGIAVRIIPVAVQGNTAARQIAAAIRAVNEMQACDVLVVTRGGGSLEDLWPFNEEMVARAVAESAIPVISAVGHERDFSICDFAADLRVATPSAAAERVVAAKAEMHNSVSQATHQLHASLLLKVAACRQRLERAGRSPVLLEPAHVVKIMQQRVDELSERLTRGLERRLAERKMATERLLSGLRALDPNAVLRRGYSVLFAGERAVRSASEVGVGDSLRAQLASGELDVQVQKVQPPKEK